MFNLLLLLASPAAFGQKKQQLREAEIEVINPVVQHQDSRITVDASLRNKGEKPARNLVVFYEVLDSDKNVLTRQKGSIEEKELAPGDEAGISAQMAFHARAVFLRLTFEDGAGRELRGINAGPFAIE